MAILADSLLSDIDALSDHEQLDNSDFNVMGDEDIDVEWSDTLKSLCLPDDIDTVSKVQNSKFYKDVMQKVEHALQSETIIGGEVEELISECNALVRAVENEINVVHSFICDKYKLKFPELESLVRNPIDYARVVKKIGNETDLTVVDLQGILPSASIMVVSVVASTTSGKPLMVDILQKTVEACDRLLDLDLDRKRVFEFMETRILHIAPNLSAVVGSAVAAKLVGNVGLAALGSMPPCRVNKYIENVAVFSTGGSATNDFWVACLKQTDIYQNTPPGLRNECFNLLATKLALAARVDSWGGDPTGERGRMLCDEIRKRMEKLQELPPPRVPKPLPVPDCESKRKKRGGRRARKMKEKYALTDMRKLANRMLFGVPEESSLGDGLGVGFGLLGQAGSGNLRVSASKKFKDKHHGRSDGTSGRISSVAFTPVGGIELPNPKAHELQLCSGTHSTYFSETGTFSIINRS